MMQSLTRLWGIAPSLKTEENINHAIKLKESGVHGFIGIHDSHCDCIPKGHIGINDHGIKRYLAAVKGVGKTDIKKILDSYGLDSSYVHPNEELSLTIVIAGEKRSKLFKSKDETWNLTEIDALFDFEATDTVKLFNDLHEKHRVVQNIVFDDSGVTTGNLGALIHLLGSRQKVVEYMTSWREYTDSNDECLD